VVINCLIVCAGAHGSAIRIVEDEPEDDVLISGPVHKGMFGGLVVKFTELNDDFACLVGGRGGFIINRVFAIGGGGYGLTNDISVRTTSPMENFRLDFGYGGVIFDLIFGSRNLLHFNVHTLIGAGSAYYRTWYYEDYWYDDVFFVAEPGCDVTLNVARSFRIDLGGSYRYIYGTDLEGISDGGLSGPAAHVMFKFGRF
jgi:hypothetical protein